MNWIDKIKSQLSRIFGADFSDEMTEAELIDKLESIESISDLRTQIKDQEGTINLQNASLEELQNQLSSFEKNIKSLTDLISSVKSEANNAISNLQTQFADEINDLKNSFLEDEENNGGRGLPRMKEKIKGPLTGDGSFIMDKIRGNQPFKNN